MSISNTMPPADQSLKAPEGFTAQIVTYLTAEQPESNFLVNTPSTLGEQTFEQALRDAIIHSGLAVGYGKPVMQKFSEDDQNLILGVFDDWRNFILSNPVYRENFQYSDLTEKELFADLLKNAANAKLAKELCIRIVNDPSFAGRVLNYAESLNNSLRLIYEWFDLKKAKSSTAVEAYLDLYELLLNKTADRMDVGKLIPKLSQFTTNDENCIKDAMIIGLLKRPNLFKLTSKEKKAVVGPIFMATRGITDQRSACEAGLILHLGTYIESNAKDICAAIWWMSKDGPNMDFWHNIGSQIDLLIRTAASFRVAPIEINNFLDAFIKLVEPEFLNPELDQLTCYEKMVACDHIPEIVLKHIFSIGRKKGLYPNEEILNAKGDELRKYAIAADYFTVQSFIEHNKKDVAADFLARDLGL